jgi:hypothetical protein
VFKETFDTNEGTGGMIVSGVVQLRRAIFLQIIQGFSLMLKVPSSALSLPLTHREVLQQLQQLIVVVVQMQR